MKITFALYFANRGFFPGESIAAARAEMEKAVTDAGFDYIAMEESLTRFGAVETIAEGKLYADFLEKNRGKYQGIIMCLPNFGDENGASEALKYADVPVLVQAYPDELSHMDFSHRRDALCGGFRSIGWDVPDSHGSMFVWAPVPQGHGTSMEFCMEMIEKAGVICTPGSSFGPSGEGYVRFALTLPVEKITEAVQAVKNSGLIG